MIERYFRRVWAMDNAATKVLGHWQPEADLTDESDENRERIGKQFKSTLAGFGYDVDTETVLSPALLAEWRDREGGWFFDWHQDCSGVSAQVVLWSNIQPVEVKFTDSGELLQANDGAVILIDNLEVEHRTPHPLRADRWLARTSYIEFQ